MRIVIHAALLKEVAGFRDLEIDAKNLGEAFLKLVEKGGEALKENLFEDECRLKTEYVVLVDGAPVHNDADYFEVELKPKGKVTILLIVSGG